LLLLAFIIHPVEAMEAVTLFLKEVRVETLCSAWLVTAPGGNDILQI
jgi:hypothetical protein